ncbi:adenosylcobinamide-phosphate synthase CbiB [Lacibacterium aquatile]|uniref:Cobalamin biosynthesis protein CobD n=1 Tax=Lacibacterium aquatile TaxID=1168082 RepID=A0ABW5DRZ5_9PROT
MSFFLLALAAMLIEAICGYPQWIIRTVGHPIMWIGALIARLDRWLNEGAHRRAKGIAALVILLGICGSIAWGLSWLPWWLLAIPASALLAQRSLYEHVQAVATGLEEDVVAGRKAVSMIVGRDPEALDEAGVARAAIESLSENFSDGIVAPVFWLAMLGFPGGVLYKAANTADSMIGHKTERHLKFGWAAARFDDLINLPASRLAGILLVLAAVILRKDWRGALRAVFRDAHRHRSPNAGYPEAAMAGALGLALAGPRAYGGVMVEDAIMGDGRRTATAQDIHDALKLYKVADGLLIALLALLALTVQV